MSWKSFVLAFCLVVLVRASLALSSAQQPIDASELRAKRDYGGGGSNYYGGYRGGYGGYGGYQGFVGYNVPSYGYNMPYGGYYGRYGDK